MIRKDIITLLNYGPNKTNICHVLMLLFNHTVIKSGYSRAQSTELHKIGCVDPMKSIKAISPWLLNRKETAFMSANFSWV